jgi:thioredoxin reductase (NADPH)
MKIYDVIIVGGGPAGYTAALYCARAGLTTLVLEKLFVGGQMTQTTQIDNYPGLPDGIDGVSLGMQMQAGAERFGAQTVYAEVLSAELSGDLKTLRTPQGDYQARAVILALGADHKHLGIEGEEALIGRGVAYCAACDGMMYRGKTVAVVGGGNSAAADAALLAKLAKKVYLIHRRDTLRASKIYHEPLRDTQNLEFLWNSAVTELIHEDRLTGVRVRDVNTGAEQVVDLDGLFISIGRSPETALFRGQLELDEQGYILAGEDTVTSVPGVFAAGDVRTKQVRQIVTATADGAIAAHMAEAYLSGIR